jgi:hypothetical protein
MGTFVTRASAAALPLLLVAPCSADSLPQKPTPFDLQRGARGLRRERIESPGPTTRLVARRVARICEREAAAVAE